MHGVCQIIENLLAPLKKWFDEHCNTQNFSWKFCRGLRTFIIVDIAWVFFRAVDVKSALYIIWKSFDLRNVGLILNGGIYQLGLDERNMSILFVGMFVLLISGVMKERGINVFHWLSEQNVVFRYLVYWSALMLIIFSVNITGQEFIYFQF